MTLEAAEGGWKVSRLLRGQESSEPIVVLLGAHASTLPPTSLPNAIGWKSLILPMITAKAGIPSDLGSSLKDAAGLRSMKLEGVLAELDACHGGLGVELACLTKSVSQPGPIHQLIAEGLRAGAVGCVVTTNWDCMIETAAGAIGLALDVWVAAPKRRWESGAQLYKLHGTDVQPESLRHTFATISQSFGEETVLGFQGLLRAPVLALGYSGDDYDVQRLFADGGPVWWLQSRSVDQLSADQAAVAPGALLLSVRRKVIPLGGGFEQSGVVLPKSAGSRINARFEAATRNAIATLRSDEAVTSLEGILYRVRANVVPTRDGSETAVGIDTGFVTWLRAQSPHYRSLYAAAVAQREQLSGSRMLAAWIEVKAALTVRSGRLRHLSNAADYLELIGGRQPPVRMATLLIHGCALLSPSANPDGWIDFRIARCLLPYRLYGLAKRFVDRVLSRRRDPYVEAHALRLQAILMARQGCLDWEEPLSRAENLFIFEGGRPQEMAHIHRARAISLFLSGARQRDVDDLLVRAAEARLRVSRHSPLESPLRRAMLLPPWLGRYLAVALAD